MHHALGRRPERRLSRERVGRLDRQTEAEGEYRVAIAHQERLSAEYPAVPAHRYGLALYRLNLGSGLARLGRRVEAEVEYRAALKQSMRLAAEHPAVLDYCRVLGQAHDSLASLLHTLGKRVEAEGEYRAALKEYWRLADEHPTVPSYRQSAALIQTRLGLLLSEQGKRQEAEVEYRALKERERVAAEHPAWPAYAVDLGGGYCDFGNFLNRGGRAAMARPWYSQAIATLSRALARLDNSGHRPPVPPQQPRGPCQSALRTGSPR